MDYGRVFKLLCRSIRHDFNGTERRTVIGDATPSTGNCWGHPGSSHSGGGAVDINYFTCGGENDNNLTHYRPHDDEHPHCDMWDDDPNNPDTNFIKLKPGVFDITRNFAFFYRLHQLIPNCRVMVNSLLYNELTGTEAVRLFGRTAVTELRKFVQGDNNASWNHHFHAHIFLRGDIDWELDISKFIKPIN